MNNNLEKQIASVRRQARILVTMTGLMRLAAVVVSVVLVLAIADYLIRYQDPGIRVMATVVAVTALVWSAYRHLYRSAIRRLGNVEVAQQVEKQFPQLGGACASAIEFLDQPEDDPRAGSAALRRTVIARCTSQLENVNIRQVIDYRPAVRAMLITGVTCILAVLVASIDTQSTQVALARMIHPLGNIQWPRKHYLEFRRAPMRIAAGESFEAELIDRAGRLPDRVEIHYQYASGDETTEEVQPMQFSAGAMIARKENVVRPFKYRAVGGDDLAMDWIAVDVVEPPRIESLRVTLHPPRYTGWSPMPSEPHIRALAGTGVALRGTATQPLRAARLVFEGGEVIEARITEDGHVFSIPPEDLTIEKPGVYWFELEDQATLTSRSRDRWEVRPVSDTPPSATIEQPASDLFATPNAVVPLRVLVKDDLAIQSVSLVYTRTDRSDEGEMVMPLFRGPEAMPIGEGAGRHDSAAAGDRRTLEKVWDISQLELTPGSHLAFHIRATDYLPQEGQSIAPRHIRILTEDQLGDRIADRQEFILGELARALKGQREIHGQTTALQVQLEQVGTLGDGNVDQLHAAELNQRQVTSLLTDPAEGIPAHVQGLLDELANNKVNRPDINERMESVMAELKRLGATHLPAIRQNLTTALKAAQTRPTVPGDETSANPPSYAPLAKASGEQEQVIDSLEQLLGDLSQWAGYQRFVREMSQIRREQEQIAQSAREVAAKTLTRNLKDLSLQERAEMKKVARRQQELARHFDRLQGRIQKASDQRDSGEPLAGQNLADAASRARQLAISGRMRQVGGDLDQNRVGQAADEQAKILADLDEIVDILANRREHESSRLVRKLREAEEDLTALRARQRGLRKKIDQARDNADDQEKTRQLRRLTRQQEAVQKEVEQLARRLMRLRAAAAGRSANRAAANLGRAGDATQSGAADQAADAAAAAEKDLDEAQSQLAEARRQAEQDLARQQMLRLEDTLHVFIERQQHLIDETARLENSRDRDGRLSRGQQETLGQLARHEELLAEETAGLAENLAGAKVFQMALESARDRMVRAAERLDHGDSDPVTQRYLQAAHHRLTLLLAALKKEGQPAGQPSQGAGGQGGNQGGSTGQKEKLRDIAELKLLRLMQEDVNLRTQSLQKQISESDPPTPEQISDREALAREQGQLADLLLDFVQADEKNESGDPADLVPFDLENQDEFP